VKSARQKERIIVILNQFQDLPRVRALPMDILKLVQDDDSLCKESALTEVART